METISVAMPPPLAIARKPFGCATSAGGPFMPIYQSFAIFFEALLSGMPLGNADIIETLAHIDERYEASDFTTHPTSERAIHLETRARPSENAAPADMTIKGSDHTIGTVATMTASDTTADPAKPTEEPVAAGYDLITEHVLNPGHSVAPEDTAAPQETIACAEDIVAPTKDASPVDGTAPEAEIGVTGPIITANDTAITGRIPEAPVIETTTVEEISEETVQILSPETETETTETFSTTEDVSTVEEIDDTTTTLSAAEGVIEPTSTIVTIPASVDIVEPLIEGTADVEIHQGPTEVAYIDEACAADVPGDSGAEIVPSHEHGATTEEVTCDTPSIAAQTVETPTQSTNSALANITNKDLDVDSESDVKVVIQDILEAHNDLDFEVDLEAESDNDATCEDVVAEIEDFPEELGETNAATLSMPAPVHPLILEDDFDAAVSSVLDTGFESLMDIDMAWSIPQIVEKGKSERDIVRERLANQTTTRFNALNLRLEKAARALSMDGTAPVQITAKVASPAVGYSIPSTHSVGTQEVDILSDADSYVVDEMDTSIDNEEVSADLVEEMRRDHSCHSSSSSTISHTSSDAAFDSADCPGTPVTQYCMTPPKVEVPHAISTVGTMLQHAAGAGKTKTGDVATNPEHPANAVFAMDMNAAAE